MIRVAGSPVRLDLLPLNQQEAIIFVQKSRNWNVYDYESVGELLFELRLRNLIIEASADLLASGAEFASFSESRCNPHYWIRTYNGGFQQRNDVTSSSAIMDIYEHGSLYAFECATAMIIVLYKAVLDAIGEERFNRIFANLVLYSWQYDGDLHLITTNSAGGAAFPGDILYFRNPDVSPEFPEWQGENVVKLGENFYYGHGIGNVPGNVIIRELNRKRIPGSRRSAYLMDQATQPDYRYLYQLTLQTRLWWEDNGFGETSLPFQLKARIGCSRYITLPPETGTG